MSHLNSHNLTLTIWLIYPLFRSPFISLPSSNNLLVILVHVSSHSYLYNLRLNVHHSIDFLICGLLSGFNYEQKCRMGCIKVYMYLRFKCTYNNIPGYSSTFAGTGGKMSRNHSGGTYYYPPASRLVPSVQREAPAYQKLTLSKISCEVHAGHVALPRADNYIDYKNDSQAYQLHPWLYLYSLSWWSEGMKFIWAPVPPF